MMILVQRELYFIQLVIQYVNVNSTIKQYLMFEDIKILTLLGIKGNDFLVDVKADYCTGTNCC